MSKLLNNLPVEDLTSENDYLGIIDKGQIIKTFLESNTDKFKDIKMFSLYGEWGSGKSSLMKYLQKELKENFNAFFFEAWEFESDSNLSLSLLEYLISKSQDTAEEAFGDIIEVASKLFKGFSKSIRISLPGLSIDGSKIVETLEEESEETFLQLKNKFKTEFRKWEDKKASAKNNKFNIVFIDDLDRCEPEHVLNLLSALKLFFTYGNKTIFFCGIDKKAVNEAVKTKYGKVVKANEYLEKIFDISFSMPESKDIMKLISLFFNDRKISEIITDPWNRFITKFFIALAFTNPRRVKKVLNKFQILRSIKENLELTEKYKRHIPNIYSENSGNIFETILVLYIIILHEFHQNYYSNLFNLRHKESILIGALKNKVSTGSYQGYLSSIGGYMNKNIIDKEIKNLDFYKAGQYDDLIFAMLPNTIIELNSNNYDKGGFESMKFSEITIEYRFLEFLINNGNIFMDKKDFSEITLSEIKNIVKSVL